VSRAPWMLFPIAGFLRHFVFRGGAHIRFASALQQQSIESKQSAIFNSNAKSNPPMVDD